MAAKKARGRKSGFAKAKQKAKVASGASRPAAFSPPPGGGRGRAARTRPVPTTEWERLWRRYTAANQSGSLKEQLAAGKALLRFDRIHGTPPLPHMVKKLRVAKQLLVRHEEAFREAKALKHEIAKAERSMRRSKPSKKTRPVQRRKPRISRLLSGG